MSKEPIPLRPSERVAVRVLQHQIAKYFAEIELDPGRGPITFSGLLRYLSISPAKLKRYQATEKYGEVFDDAMLRIAESYEIQLRTARTTAGVTGAIFMLKTLGLINPDKEDQGKATTIQNNISIPAISWVKPGEAARIATTQAKPEQEQGEGLEADQSDPDPDEADPDENSD